MSAVKKSRAYYHGKLEYLQYMKLPHQCSYCTLHQRQHYRRWGIRIEKKHNRLTHIISNMNKVNIKLFSRIFHTFLQTNDLLLLSDLIFEQEDMAKIYRNSSFFWVVLQGTAVSTQYSLSLSKLVAATAASVERSTDQRLHLIKNYGHYCC